MRSHKELSPDTPSTFAIKHFVQENKRKESQSLLLVISHALLHAVLLLFNSVSSVSVTVCYIAQIPVFLSSYNNWQRIQRKSKHQLSTLKIQVCVNRFHYCYLSTANKYTFYNNLPTKKNKFLNFSFTRALHT